MQCFHKPNKKLISSSPSWKEVRFRKQEYFIAEWRKELVNKTNHFMTLEKKKYLARKKSHDSPKNLIRKYFERLQYMKPNHKIFPSPEYATLTIKRSFV